MDTTSNVRLRRCYPRLQPLIDDLFSNRQPLRVETTLTYGKQSNRPRSNRQLFGVAGSIGDQCCSSQPKGAKKLACGGHHRRAPDLGGASSKRGGTMSGFLSPEELKKLKPAETSSFPSPIPTQIVSSDEFFPQRQNRRQREVEARLKEMGNKLARKQGMSRRAFFTTAAGMA